MAIAGIHQSFGDNEVLSNVSTSIAKGTVTSIIGPNGAGKSTLLAIMSRLASPTQGSVHVDGLDVQTTASKTIATKLAVLRQENTVGVRLTVRELVGFGRFPHDHGRHRAEDIAAIDEALDYLELTDLADRFLDELSGGQRQRAFVAMVLAQDTDYVFLDEPLNNLDMKHAANMMKRVWRASRELGKTFVLVIHDINVAAAYCDHIIALRDGRVVADGSPASVMDTDVLRDIYDMDMPVIDVNGQKMAMYFGRPD
ncbi:ATP-binding cassette domain-containing protein [Corynebacterium sp. TAE3-ERU12]|nr:ATP-binding cassette domain-containing protein [Corynebacterium sp. TAE3-ERU12]